MFAPLNKGPCRTDPDSERDVQTFYAERLAVCFSLCFVEGFPCSAVEHDAETLRCRIHYAPVSAGPEEEEGGARCYTKLFAPLSPAPTGPAPTAGAE